MALVIGDRVLDAGLSALDTEADKIYVCSAQPTTYTEATSTYALGNKNFGAGAAFAAPTAATLGRKTQSVAITDGSVTANGTVSHWAAVDSANSRLLASDVVTGGAAVTSGQQFTLASFAVQMAGTSGAASGSGWGDHGSWLNAPTTTAVTDDTITGGVTSGVATARGAQGHAAASGKWYFEVKLLTAPSGGSNIFDIGLLNATTAAGSLNNTNIPHGCLNHCYDGAAWSGSEVPGGVSLGSAVTLSNGDILGVAFDAVNGFHYLRKNNAAWFLSGDPTSGGSGTGHVGGYNLPDARTYYPAIAIFAVAANSVAQLITTTGGFTYSPPSGYSEWG